MSWIDDEPQPERDIDDLRTVVASKAGRLRARRRLAMAGGAVAVVVALLAVITLPDGGGKPRQLQVASRPDATSATAEPTADGTADPSSGSLLDPGSTTTTVPGRTTTTTRPRGTPAGTSSPTTTVPHAACGDASAYLSQSETQAAVVGTWVVCSGSAFGLGEAGIEVRADGRWSKLVRGSDGSLQRTHGWDNSGAWTAVQEAQVNYDLDGSGGYVTQASFDAARSSMRLNNNGVLVGDYARVAPGTTVADQPKTGTNDCTRDEGAVRTTSTENDFRSAFVHTWVLCQSPSYFGTDAAGLDVRADGSWSEMARQGDGTLVAQGLSGTWEVIDTSAMNGPGHFQVNFNTSEGSRGTFPVFATDTSKMRLGDYNGGRHDYVLPGT